MSLNHGTRGLNPQRTCTTSDSSLEGNCDRVYRIHDPNNGQNLISVTVTLSQGTFQ